jgi:hypothetical protein
MKFMRVAAEALLVMCKLVLVEREAIGPFELLRNGGFADVLFMVSYSG